MTDISIFGNIACKATFILATAFLVAPFLRRASAAARHLLWAQALITVVLLPLAVSSVPAWNAGRVFTASPSIQKDGSSMDAPVRHAAISGNHKAAAEPSVVWWLWLWTAGCAIAATRFIRATLRTRSVVRRAKLMGCAKAIVEEIAPVLGIRRDVLVLKSAELPVPFAWGVLRPVVVLPEAAANWPEARTRAVLWHELTHIRRHDVLAQALAQVACCLYWFHPLAWLASSRLRQEREFACDDAVLAAGVMPQEYATALIDLARALALHKGALAEAPAITEGHHLESRVRALFDRSRNRRPISMKSARAIKVALLALLLPVASIGIQADVDRASVAGIVMDPSGARIPHATVTADHQHGANRETTRCNAAGEYRFSGIPAGEYVLKFASTEFAPTSMNIVLKAGEAARVDARLDLGSASEAITVTGRKPSSALPSGTATGQQIRLGGTVRPVKLIHQVQPDYPAGLQRLGVEGTVMIRAVISINGEVLSPEVISAGVDARLAQLALDAVKQWRYEPSLLNGEPVETASIVTIDFALQSGAQ